jgi:hypothetical protein
MKNAAPAFGHIDPGYRLQEIFFRTVFDFGIADTEYAKLEEQYKTDPSGVVIQKMFEVGATRREAGVIAILAAGAFLEGLLYAYAIHHIDVDSYETHLDNLRAISKWIILPKLCQNKEIGENSPVIADLKYFVRVRNSIIHPKRRVIGTNLNVFEKSNKEEEDFLSVARRLELIVSNARHRAFCSAQTFASPSFSLFPYVK